jgi:indole-3-glycerol phosphate synthase
MNILEKIAALKKEEVAKLQRERGLESLKVGAISSPPPRSIRAALQRKGRLSLIAEIKKASPSKGLIRPDFDPVEIALAYERAGAHAISVLTDAHHFQGSLDYLRAVRETVELPLLRKEFIIDPLQVYETREAGADAVLLIVALLEKEKLSDLRLLARSLGLGVLVEVHDLAEMETALGVGSDWIGINNRNLKDFMVSLKVTRDLIAQVPPMVPVVSESGILTRTDAETVKALGASAVLVGEIFMRSQDPGEAVKALMPEGDLGRS